jgi:hypothetical protein
MLSLEVFRISLLHCRYCVRIPYDPDHYFGSPDTRSLTHCCLENLRLQNNLFIGPIPPSITAVTSLRTWILDVGPLPLELFAILSHTLGSFFCSLLLGFLYMSENALEGTLSWEMGFLTNLGTFVSACLLLNIYICGSITL